MLGVNRLTLRTAISHLQAEGLLRAQQGQGITVCDFHKTASLELLKYLPLDERLSEVLSLRQLVLADAVSDACTNATTADINRLKSIAAQQLRCTKDEQFIEGDTQFFLVVLESTQNFTLQLLYNSIHRITDTQESWTKHLLSSKQQALGSYQAFKKMFEKYSKQAGKKQYLIPYFIAAHPGCTDEDMMNLSLWLKKNDFRIDQVQTFYPSPMALATAMYHSGRNPLKKLNYKRGEKVFSAKKMDQRRLQKSFLRYHDEKNWAYLRESLLRMNRRDLIGSGDHQLVPEEGHSSRSSHSKKREGGSNVRNRKASKRHNKARGGQWSK